MDMEAVVTFDFFGLGQTVNGPVGQEEQNDDQQQDAWDPWPAEFRAQQQPMQVEPPMMQDLNEAPINNQIQLNLNLPTENQDINQDLHPVIFNPVVPEGNGIENDLQINMHEQHLLQPQGEVYILNPLEEELMLIADEEMQPQMEIPNPQIGIPPSPINYLDDEIPLDQLMGSESKGSPMQSEE